MSPSTPETPSDAQTLLRYTHWAHGRVLDALRSVDPVPERVLELTSHMLRSQDVWYGRVANTDHAEIDIWAVDDLQACVERAEGSMERWQDLLHERANRLHQPIAYTNSKGTAFKTPLRDILRHVVNHGTHHRAQIALLLREAGIPPPATGYIVFVRENGTED
ncbi:MAG: DinB family protein [Salinivenus sp.]